MGVLNILTPSGRLTKREKCFLREMIEETGLVPSCLITDCLIREYKEQLLTEMRDLVPFDSDFEYHDLTPVLKVRRFTLSEFSKKFAERRKRSSVNGDCLIRINFD